MTDLEITKRCAEAMRVPYKISLYRGEEFIEIISERNPGNGGEYNPLRDDEQCFALVKMFELRLRTYVKNKWQVWAPDQADTTDSTNGDLNRAICECVAKMEKP